VNLSLGLIYYSIASSQPRSRDTVPLNNTIPRISAVDPNLVLDSKRFVLDPKLFVLNPDMDRLYEEFCIQI
jgi:hypothetical protein